MINIGDNVIVMKNGRSGEIDNVGFIPGYNIAIVKYPGGEKEKVPVSDLIVIADTESVVTREKYDEAVRELIDTVERNGYESKIPETDKISKMIFDTCERLKEILFND